MNYFVNSIYEPYGGSFPELILRIMLFFRNLKISRPNTDLYKPIYLRRYNKILFTKGIKITLELK